MIPRFDEAIKSGIRYRDRPGAYGILLHGRRVLLTFQSLPKPEYQLPGGGIDPGESPTRALHREVFEETGWGIEVIRRLGAFRRYTYMPEYDLWARKVAHIYLCRPTREKGPIPEPNHTAHWMDIREAARLLANGGDRFYVRRLIQHLNQHG
jgi:8-oxo-dGTP diphosphatase